MDLHSQNKSDGTLPLLSGENNAFWGDEKRDGEMNQYLNREYERIFEYDEGGIHSALYKKADIE